MCELNYNSIMWNPQNIFKGEFISYPPEWFDLIQTGQVLYTIISSTSKSVSNNTDSQTIEYVGLATIILKELNNEERLFFKEYPSDQEFEDSPLEFSWEKNNFITYYYDERMASSTNNLEKSIVLATSKEDLNSALERIALEKEYNGRRAAENIREKKLN